MRPGSALLLSVLLAPMALAETPRPPPPRTTEAACKAAGGRWDPIKGRGHVTGCNLPTTDGGKACTDSDQCQGACQNGTCSQYREVRGCGIQTHGGMRCED